MEYKITNNLRHLAATNINLLIIFSINQLIVLPIKCQKMFQFPTTQWDACVVWSTVQNQKIFSEHKFSTLRRGLFFVSRLIN